MSEKPDTQNIRDNQSGNTLRTLGEWKQAAEKEGNNLYQPLEKVSTDIQEILKVEGDWQIYPFAVRELIAKGSVAVDGRTVYIDGVQMPKEGWQVDQYGFADRIR